MFIIRKLKTSLGALSMNSNDNYYCNIMRTVCKTERFFQYWPLLLTSRRYIFTLFICRCKFGVVIKFTIGNITVSPTVNVVKARRSHPKRVPNDLQTVVRGWIISSRLHRSQFNQHFNTVILMHFQRIG